MEMNQGARDANDEIRHYSERQHREHVVQLLARIEQVLTAVHKELVWRFRDDPAAADPPAPPQEP